MQRLLINRVSLTLRHSAPIFLIVSATNEPALSQNKARWVRDSLSESDRREFFKWMDRHQVDEGTLLATEFKEAIAPEDQAQDTFFAELTDENLKLFRREIFKQELGRHLLNKGFFIDTFRLPLDFASYQMVNPFDDDYDQYRRVDFRWNPGREELSFNFGSEKTLITKAAVALEGGAIVFDLDKHLVYKAQENIKGKTLCPKEVRKQCAGAPKKFDYKERFQQLKEFAANHLYDLNSPFLAIDKTGLINVNPDDFHNVFAQQNLMTFGNEQTAINAVIGMREYGPFRKAKDAEKKRLLFIYQNKNDANTLYRYFKNGLKHFPGLLSYVGIPVALAEPDKGLPYKDVTTLAGDLEGMLDTHYSDRPLYPDVLAIVIGPFKRYESDEEESDSYYEIKKILLDKGIASQFVSSDTLNSYGVHYSLPNIAIAILAKLGGVPWKLANKRTNELIVGFNTKRAQGEERHYLGSAVFFDNEGRLGGVRGLPAGNGAAIIGHLRVAITEYMNQVGEPDRLVIHYYKPSRKDEIRHIEKLLEQMGLAIPVAIVEVNDYKSKLDICFDPDFEMGMPESGVFVKIGYNEYLLFNNNRYIKSPPRKIDDELPIKLKLRYFNTGGFSTHELIAQVYEFSRLNWKGLRQRSVPVTTTYSKAIAEFALHFNGEIPQNEVATKAPWFI